MKVITIKQPWASLIANGYKDYEFRTWKTKYRGEVLIHAGKSIDKDVLKRFEHLNLDYPCGCIIAKAIITDCIFINDEIRDELAKKDNIVYKSIINNKEWKGYGFKLDDIHKIKPIPINGQLSFWNYDDKIEVLDQ
ncbi:MAG: ASCH domain-containing protein [Bacilli bacterium]